MSRPGNDPRIRVSEDSAILDVFFSPRGIRAKWRSADCKGGHRQPRRLSTHLPCMRRCSGYLATAVGTLRGRSKWNDRTSTPVTVAKGGETVLLVYPMRRHKHHNLDEYLMRVKTVDATTGQLNMCWCVIHEIALKENGDVEKSTRHVRNFRIRQVMKLGYASVLRSRHARVDQSCPSLFLPPRLFLHVSSTARRSLSSVHPSLDEFARARVSSTLTPVVRVRAVRLLASILKEMFRSRGSSKRRRTP